jgi:hypothetical protein
LALRHHRRQYLLLLLLQMLRLCHRFRHHLRHRFHLLRPLDYRVHHHHHLRKLLPRQNMNWKFQHHHCRHLL